MQCVNMLYDLKNGKNKETVFLQQTLIFCHKTYLIFYLYLGNPMLPIFDMSN